MNKKTEKTLMGAILLGALWVGADLPGLPKTIRKRIEKGK